MNRKSIELKFLYADWIENQIIISLMILIEILISRSAILENRKLSTNPGYNFILDIRHDTKLNYDSGAHNYTIGNVWY